MGKQPGIWQVAKYRAFMVGAVYSLDFTGKPRFVLWMCNKGLSYPEIHAVNENLLVLSIINHVICFEKKIKK
ncbi:hypothetical protein D3C81_1211960 [compost metagenome]